MVLKEALFLAPVKVLINLVLLRSRQPVAHDYTSLALCKVWASAKVTGEARRFPLVSHVEQSLNSRHWDADMKLADEL